MADRPTTIYVCIRCNYTQSDAERAGARSGSHLYAEVERQFAAWPHRAAFTLTPVECMSNCKRACTVALAAPEKYTYMFGDLKPGAEAAAAVLTCAQFYATKSDGFMDRVERPEALRSAILARIPPLRAG